MLLSSVRWICFFYRCNWQQCVRWCYDFVDIINVALLSLDCDDVSRQIMKLSNSVSFHFQYSHHWDRYNMIFHLLERSFPWRISLNHLLCVSETRLDLHIDKENITILPKWWGKEKNPDHWYPCWAVNWCCVLFSLLRYLGRQCTCTPFLHTTNCFYTFKKACAWPAWKWNLHEIINPQDPHHQPSPLPTQTVRNVILAGEPWNIFNVLRSIRCQIFLWWMRQEN